VKPESKFWKEIKKNTPRIKWTRLETWAAPGVPDLLGYNDFCGFFMVELKVATKSKPRFSPHQIMFHRTRTNRNFILLQTLAPRSVKLYPSTAMREDGTLGACCLTLEACDLDRSPWSTLEAWFIHGPLDACSL
jgi:hypothetical protein